MRLIPSSSLHVDADHLCRLCHLAVHLRNLSSFLARTSPVIERDGHALINFTRYKNLRDHIRSFLLLKLPESPIIDEESSRAVIYLEGQLYYIGVDAETHKAFETRSKELALQERVLHEQRVPELRALGFSTGPGSP